MSRMTLSNNHGVKDKTGEVLRLDDQVEFQLGMQPRSGRVVGFGHVPPFVIVEDMDGDEFTVEGDQIFSDRGADRLVAEAKAKRRSPDQ